MHSNENKRLFKNSIFLAIKLVINIVVSLYISRIVLKELGVVDFGIYNIVGGVVTMLAFLNSALTSSTQRFFSFEIGIDGNIKKIFSMSLNIYFILIVSVVVLSQTIGLWVLNTKLNIPVDRVVAAYFVYQFSVLSFIITLVTTPYNSMMLARENMKLYSMFGVFSVLFKFILVVTLIRLPYDKLVSYSALMVVSSLFMFLLPFLYCLKNEQSARYQFLWDKKLFHKFFSYSSWSLFGGMAAVGANQGVNILLNIFFGPVVNAARGISMQLNSAILGLSSNVNLSISPQVIKRYSRNELDSMFQLVYAGTRYSFLFVMLVSLPILFYTSEILQLWLGTVPDFTMTFTQLIIIDTLICVFSSSLITVVQATGRIRFYQFVIGSLLLFNIPISYFILKYYANPIYPFIVTITLSLAASILRLIFLRVLIGLSILKFFENVIYRSLVTFIASSTAIFISQLIMVSSPVINFVTCCFINLFFIFMIGLNKKERDFILNIIQVRSYN